MSITVSNPHQVTTIFLGVNKKARHKCGRGLSCAGLFRRQLLGRLVFQLESAVDMVGQVGIKRMRRAALGRVVGFAFTPAASSQAYELLRLGVVALRFLSLHQFL